MKIAFLTPWNQNEGLSKYSQWLVGELEKKIEVRVLAMDGEIKKRFENIDEINQFDLLHIQHELSQWGSFVNPCKSSFFRFMDKIKIPKVVTFHSVDLKGTTWKKWGPWGRRRFIQMHNLPDKSIVHTQFLKDGLVETGIDEKKIEVVPIGIPLINSKFKIQNSKVQVKSQNSNDQIDLSGRRIIAIFGFINPDKGYELVLEALPKLPKDVVFVIAGGVQDETNNQYFQNLRSTMEQWNNETMKRAIITGFLEEDEMLELMSASAVILFPRKHVNASLEMSIAIALNKPILASNLPSFKEINNRVPCLEIFDLNRSDDFCYRLMGILENEGLRAKLIEMTRLYAQQYSWERIAEKTIMIYEEVLK